MQKVEKTIAGKEMRLETGRIARQSNGAVLVSLGETTVLATVNAAKEPREDIDFFPLQVEYREKHYAGGKIPGGFFKREARPAEHEVLTSRLTDRPLRPLFPKGFKNETQVMITVLQSDGENMADVLAGVGASAALMCSTIPWNGPIASVRIGRVDGAHIVNPTRSEMEDSDLELIVSGNEETVVMVEGEATCMSESDMILALKEAHSKIKEIIELQNELLSSLNVVKDEFIIPEPDSELNDAIINLIENSISLSPKKSKILIELDKIDEETISIRFYDQGKGIDLKDSEKIFDRFYSDRQENIKNHSGLGLSIAREIISHMNGKISLDKSNKIEYSGACFLITLPVRHSSKLN